MLPQITCLRRGIVTLVAFVWLFSTVPFQMSLPLRIHSHTVRFQMGPQTACIIGCKVTLVAFVLFSPLCIFKMLPQIVCLRRCIVTLVAFVWLFSAVHFQMCPQSACIRGCIVTLVALVWLLSTVCFQIILHNHSVLHFGYLFTLHNFALCSLVWSGLVFW